MNVVCLAVLLTLCGEVRGSRGATLAFKDIDLTDFESSLKSRLVRVIAVPYGDSKVFKYYGRWRDRMVKCRDGPTVFKIWSLRACLTVTH